MGYAAWRSRETPAESLRTLTAILGRVASAVRQRASHPRGEPLTILLTAVAGGAQVQVSLALRNGTWVACE